MSRHPGRSQSATLPMKPATASSVDAALAHARMKGVADADAQILLLHGLGRPRHDRAWLRAHGEAPVGEAEYQHFCAHLDQRLDGVPVAYLTGWREFYGLELGVGPAVLDPRPDTETLVDWALECLPLDRPVRVLDLGTGSGAVILAIKSQRPHVVAVATDRSATALEMAQANGRRHALAVDWRLSSADETGSESAWFAPIRTLPAFDLVVSNPPYLSNHDPHLPSLRHEPRSALVAGPDGLSDLQAIVLGARRHLQPGGLLLLEHGHDQAAPVWDLLDAQGYARIATRRDLAGIVRCTGGIWENS